MPAQTGPPSAEARLELQLLGPGTVRLDGRELKLATRKLLGLLAYLVMEGETSRGKLADLFWSDNTERDARRNLRRELYRLRELGLGEHLLTGDDGVALREPLGLDVSAFEALTAAGELKAGLELYRGELLEGLQLEGAGAFEAWLELRRAALAARRRRAMLELAERLETRGDWAAALELHQRLLAEDPLQERQHREVMRLQYQLGAREEALVQFERCRRVLHHELGLEPLPETVALAERIRVARDLEPEARPQTAGATPLRLPLTGREAALAELAASRAPLVLILGEPGVGKTRLLEAHAPERLRLEFRQVSSGIPLYAVAQALREALSDPERAVALWSLEPVWRREVARLVPELALGDEPGSASGQGASPQDRHRFLEGLARAFDGLNLDDLILEDLHWADATSLEWIAHLLRRRPAGSAPQFLATARADELSPAVSAWLRALEREAMLHRLHLAPLTEADLAALLGAMGLQFRSSFAVRLHQTTAGNPLFVLETIRDLLERRALHLGDAAGSGSDLSEAALQIPPSVRAAVLERVARLGGAAERLLETAALTEAGFRLEEIRPATALNEWEGLEGLERAVAAGVLERLEGGYGFAHDLVRQALESRLGPERRRLIHTKLATSFEGLGAAPARIADHFERGGAPAEAVRWRVRAAEAAARLYAYREALEQYARALSHEPPPRTAFQIRAERIAVLRTLDDPGGIAAELEELHRLAAGLEDEAIQISAQLLQASIDQEQGRAAQALQISDALMERADLDPEFAARLTPEQRLEASYTAAVAARTLARLEDADARLERGLTWATDPRWRGKFLIARCQVQARLGHAAVAAELADEALRAFRRAQDRAGEVEAAQGAGIVAMARGEFAAAQGYFQSSLELARQIDERRFQRSSLMNLVAMHLNLGQLGAVRANLEELLSLPSETLDPVLRARVHYYAGHYHHLVGELGAALEHRLEHQRLALSLDAPHERVVAGLGVAVLLLECGDTDAARALLAELEALADQHGLAGAALELRLTRFEADLLGDQPPAPEELERLIERAAGDPELHALTHIMLARAHGRDGAARRGLTLLESLAPSDLHPRLRAVQIGARLTLLAALRETDDAVLETAQQLLRDETIAPLERFGLRRALLGWLEATAQVPAARALRLETRVQTEALAATLETHPELQAHFRQRHRDLLS